MSVRPRKTYAVFLFTQIEKGENCGFIFIPYITIFVDTGEPLTVADPLGSWNPPFFWTINAFE